MNRKTPVTLLSTLLGLALGSPGLSAQTATATPAPSESEEIVRMSPFEVVVEQQGYYAPNTMSGTRLNSKVEDLAASLTVVTKQQMEDFGLLDMNDVFLYEASTEGTGTYTEFEFDRNGAPVDNTQLNPNTANRIRGIGAANISRGNFATSGRVPIDPIDIDALEISRGPNANIFGLGNAGGSVNVVPASANLRDDRSQAGARIDSFDGYRVSLDLNRVIQKDVLAVRGSIVRSREGFDRKPSGLDSTRYNAMVKFRPFKSTTLSATYQRYHVDGVRPNTTMPRDGVSGWINAGKPTWNPITQRYTLNGVPSASTYTLAQITSTGFFGRPPFFTGGTLRNAATFVDETGNIGWWGPAQATTGDTPFNRNMQVFVVDTLPADPYAGQPLFPGSPVLTNQSIYDWSSINLSAPNSYVETTTQYNIGLEQFFLDTPRQVLALQLGFFEEKSERYKGDPIGKNNSQGSAGVLYVDVNEKLPDGTNNPYFLRPYIGVWQDVSIDQPLRWKTSRAQLAYKLDLRKEKNLLRWLGMHQIAVYGEYKDYIQRRLDLADTILSDHSWINPSFFPQYPVRTQNQSVILGTYRYYVGDVNGQNIDYAPHPFPYGNYTFTWGTPQTATTTANIRKETATIGEAVSGFGRGTRSRQILKTGGAILQSYFLKDRVVTTFGIRRDRSYTTNGAPTDFLPDGINVDMERFLQFSTEIGEPWGYAAGNTRTAGVVVKALPWLYLHANTSDSFVPNDEVEQDMDTLQVVPNPTGEGKDYGFTLNLFGGKLIAKFNQYKTEEINSRKSLINVITTRAESLDFDTQNHTPFRLVPLAKTWVLAANPGLPQDQINAKVSEITGVPRVYFEPDPDAVIPYNFAATGDVVAKGREIEIYFSPSNFWTVKANVTETESIDTKIAPGILNFLTARLPFWTSVKDPTIPGNPLWWDYDYGGSRTAHEFYDEIVKGPLDVFIANLGKSRPQIRKYRANLTSSYRLAGFTDNRWLKRLTVGGALRWEDKGAIGYYGVQQLPAIITELDPDRPIYDKSHLYVDAFLSYRTRLFSDKVNATFQLNVRNLQESGRLQAVKAAPDGTGSSYRIIDPRLFILSATFDL
ncbi:MAG: hypothetical protein A3G75_03150 [Verrucomicrobia bacterium RIFCSPLOWO2_12_FULL_64_8]|nr:MAG: hypothetical protein A3G75_03150 [Verrucomicrobia bacterium RIFCSPLOWO2_12_FULL_64_8]